MRADLYDVCRLFRWRCRLQRLSVLTDGTEPALAESFADKLLFAHPGLSLTVVVSVEGLSEEHDRLRGRPGAFDAALETLHRLRGLKARRSGLEVGVRTVVSASSAAGAQALMDLVFDRVRPDFHEFDLARPGTDSGTGPPSAAAVSELYRAVLANKRRYLERAGAGRLMRALVLTLAAAGQDLQRTQLEGRGPVLRCCAGSKAGVIEPDGSVRFCEWLPSVGGLRAAGMDFRKVWESACAGDRRRALLREGCCCTDVRFLKMSAAGSVSSALRLAWRLPGAWRRARTFLPPVS